MIHLIVTKAGAHKQDYIVCLLRAAGTDGSGPPGGGAVHPHPEAHRWNQLPICRPHAGGHELTAGHSAAAGAGIMQAHAGTPQMAPYVFS